jgi:hypothetical protein
MDWHKNPRAEWPKWARIGAWFVTPGCILVFGWVPMEWILWALLALTLYECIRANIIVSFEKAKKEYEKKRYAFMTKEELTECLNYEVDVSLDGKPALSVLILTPNKELAICYPVPPGMKPGDAWLSTKVARVLSKEDMENMRLIGPNTIFSNIRFTSEELK